MAGPKEVRRREAREDCWSVTQLRFSLLTRPAVTPEYAPIGCSAMSGGLVPDATIG